MTVHFMFMLMFFLCLCVCFMFVVASTLLAVAAALDHKVHDLHQLRPQLP